MLRHVVLFRLVEDAPDGVVEGLCEGLAHLARTIPQIETYTYGADLGLRPDNYDLAVVADFADAAAFAGYVDHPEHQAFLRERLMPVLAERVALQFDL